MVLRVHKFLVILLAFHGTSFGGVSSSVDQDDSDANTAQLTDVPTYPVVIPRRTVFSVATSTVTRTSVETKTVFTSVPVEVFETKTVLNTRVVFQTVTVTPTPPEIPHLKRHRKKHRTTTMEPDMEEDDGEHSAEEMVPSIPEPDVPHAIQVTTMREPDMENDNENVAAAEVVPTSPEVPSTRKHRTKTTTSEPDTENDDDGDSAEHNLPSTTESWRPAKRLSKIPERIRPTRTRKCPGDVVKLVNKQTVTQVTIDEGGLHTVTRWATKYAATTKFVDSYDPDVLLPAKNGLFGEVVSSVDSTTDDPMLWVFHTVYRDRTLPNDGVKQQESLESRYWECPKLFPE